MPRSFKVHLHTFASATVPVTLSDEDLVKISDSIGVPVADLTLDDLTETLEERASDNTPTLGICCSGWNKWEASLELGDEWELSNSERSPLDAFTETTGETD